MTKDANMTELMGKYGANRLMYGTNFPEPAVYCDQTKVLTHTHSTVAFDWWPYFDRWPVIAGLPAAVACVRQLVRNARQRGGGGADGRWDLQPSVRF